MNRTIINPDPQFSPAVQVREEALQLERAASLANPAQPAS